ncbi:MAG: YdcF family protein [Bacilli bacterium]|nr:YdcF family protein [Bacilli bacterium]
MKNIIKIVIILISIMVLGPKFINDYVIISTKDKIISEKDYDKLTDIDCILILGAGAWGNSPSPLLGDRLDKGIELYQLGISEKILMSGDHGQIEYDEVNVMKDYALEKNIPSNDIFMDHAGFSTYESMYRAKAIFKAKKIVIVTQEYHLYRSIYIAEKLGLEAYGIAAEEMNYPGQYYRDIREVLARNKDFVKVIIKPKPTYLGEEIPISGNGNITNDK